ncbi:GGDEF domain-containing protein [Sphingomonas sp. LT1P40]|uniref:GGDEF domain-containing protein n=1 Tax=Alteristakelama amylovorans TaxID=3096166 RepID=UPI002FC879A4
MVERAQKLNDVVYVELVRSLFATPLAPLIMSSVFTLAFVLIGTRHLDAVHIATGVAGIAASLARLVTVGWYRREALSDNLAPLRARLIERRFAVTYLAFAACLGVFGARVFTLALPEAHVLAVCVMVGYCAGAAAGVGLRPGIAIPSMLLAIGPTIVIAAIKGDILYLGMSIAAAALLAGGAQNVIARNRTTMAEIGKRVTFASLARQDGLTALPNRLGLREWFEAAFTLGPDTGAIAVHYLDLDGFKPVNDRYGHPVGDALLGAVGERLSDALRPADIAARLGGDEFAIIQSGLRRSEESELLAQRLVATLRRPFTIGGHVIEISTCIGTVIATDRTRDLEQLLMEADQALYRAKRRGRGSVEQSAAA